MRIYCQEFIIAAAAVPFLGPRTYCHFVLAAEKLFRGVAKLQHTCKPKRCRCDAALKFDLSRSNFQVECDPFCRDILRARQIEGHLAPAPIFEDVCSFDPAEHRDLLHDVTGLSGGFPCQVSCHVVGWLECGVKRVC